MGLDLVVWRHAREPLTLALVPWTAIAVPITGQRLATAAKRDTPALLLPCAVYLEQLVESARMVAGDVLCRKGHMIRG